MPNQIANITVKYVNQRNGNRPPSIKADDGNYYTVSDGGIGMFQQGQHGALEFFVNQKNFRIAVAWNGQSLPRDGQPQNSAQGYQDAAQPSRQQTPQQGHNNPPGDTKSEDMFVMGVVGRAMGSGQFASTDIARLAKAAVQAWRERNDHGGFPGNEAPDHDPYAGYPQ